MAAVLTNPRVFCNSIVGVAWQAAEGTAVEPTEFIWTKVVKINPQQTNVDGQGSHGSIFKRKEGVAEAAKEPMADLTFHPTKAILSLFLESLTDKSTVIDANLTEAGDNLSQLSSWTLNGVRPLFNTDSTFKIHVTLTDNGGASTTIQLYSDAAKSNLIAEVTATTSTGTKVLVEKNNSGLTGTVDLDVFPSTTDSDITLTINKIQFPWQKTISNFFTFDLETGQERFRLTDCWVSKLEFNSVEKELLEAVATVQAKDLTVLATSFAGSKPSDFTTYGHWDLTVTDNGQSKDLAVREFSTIIENTFEMFVGNSNRPQKIIKDAWTLLTGSLTARYSDEMRVILDRALAVTFANLVAKWTAGGKILEVKINNPVFQPSDIPGFSAPTFDAFVGAFEAFFDGTLDPYEVSLEL